MNFLIKISNNIIYNRNNPNNKPLNSSKFDSRHKFNSHNYLWEIKKKTTFYSNKYSNQPNCRVSLILGMKDLLLLDKKVFLRACQSSSYSKKWEFLWIWKKLFWLWSSKKNKNVYRKAHKVKISRGYFLKKSNTCNKVKLKLAIILI